MAIEKTAPEMVAADCIRQTGLKWMGMADAIRCKLLS